MAKKMSETTCEDFVGALAAKTSVPGGGGASALVGAIGVALCSMVGNFTLGRKKYAHFEADVNRMLGEGESIQKDLLALIDEDAKAFEPLSKAYAIPKDDPKREVIMEKALMDASMAPLNIMRKCCEAIDLLEEMLEKGSVMLISDVGCGALFAKAALLGASLNIYINTKSFSNRAEAEKIEAEVTAMIESYTKKADQIAAAVSLKIRGEA
ncbi:cyclodeaminase/cyclohydrolase family protein [Fusibacter paucivorans]|uniref:Cyclodeaminase/cyclohydrolase family protein n=1 Tax=Fusibacter paucivorans TaxID=76009 RepID=A0ABS5PP95_9FIRM|nr:cyclodeaminase/cyclohydrolase family protein [Fusibacter paucivorans]MBS7526994.1 cyclodeaminase/cyclohydrolase family protein [Fusibacter paucivorans]